MQRLQKLNKYFSSLKMQQLETQKESQNSKILFYNHKNYAEVLINREKALNAMDNEMCALINKQYANWINPENKIKYVIFQGKGRAFCAGGDIKSSYQKYKQYEDNKEELYKILDLSNIEEYKMYYNLAIMNNQISFMDGIIMGGGSGLGVYAKHRIVTEKTIFAMPETKIGFFCDVGCSVFYSRLRSNIGLYLGLTGQKLNGQEMVSLGLADYYISSNKVQDLKEEIFKYLDNNDYGNIEDLKIKQIFQKYNEPLIENFKIQNEEQIEQIFQNNQSYEQLIAHLESQNTEFSKITLKTLSEQCPLSLKVMFELLKRGKTYDIKKAFQVDFRLAHWFQIEGEFFEGTRCVLVDKNDKPKYKYKDTSQVTDQLIKSLFETGFEAEKLFDI